MARYAVSRAANAEATTPIPASSNAESAKAVASTTSCCTWGHSAQYWASLTWRRGHDRMREPIARPCDLPHWQSAARQRAQPVPGWRQGQPTLSTPA
jgi:hypothetical protein